MKIEYQIALPAVLGDFQVPEFYARVKGFSSSGELHTNSNWEYKNLIDQQVVEASNVILEEGDRITGRPATDSIFDRETFRSLRGRDNFIEFRSSDEEQNLEEGIEVDVLQGIPVSYLSFTEDLPNQNQEERSEPLLIPFSLNEMPEGIREEFLRIRRKTGERFRKGELWSQRRVESMIKNRCTCPGGESAACNGTGGGHEDVCEKFRTENGVGCNNCGPHSWCKNCEDVSILYDHIDHDCTDECCESRHRRSKEFELDYSIPKKEMAVVETLDLSPTATVSQMVIRKVDRAKYGQ